MMAMHSVRSRARARCGAIIAYGVNGVWSAPFGVPRGYALCGRCVAGEGQEERNG